MQYLRRCRIRAYGHQTARIPRFAGRKSSALPRTFSEMGQSAGRSAPELREGKVSTETFRLNQAGLTPATRVS